MAVSVSLNIKQNSQSVAANTSNVTVQVVVTWIDGSYNAYTDEGNAPTCWLTIDGANYFKRGPFNSNATTSGNMVYMERTVNIRHDADGDKTLVCSAEFHPNIAEWDHQSVSASQTLTHIPRASQPSCVTYPEHTQNVGEFGDIISIHMNREFDQFTHTVRYAFGSLSGTIATDVDTDTTWTIPLAFMDLLPAAVKGSGTIYVDTMYQESVIGTKSCGFTASVPAGIKPTCSMTLTDVANIDDIYGSPVQSLSRINVKVEAATAYSSPIAAYEINIDGTKYTAAEITTGALRNAGESEVSIKVTDKRGRTATETYTMQVQAYTPPTITKLNVHRCNVDGTENPQGEYISITFSAVVSSMSNKNTAEFLLGYKKSAESEYLYRGFAFKNPTYSLTDETVIIQADSNSAYDILVEVQDSHHTTGRTTSASTAFALMNWGANGTSMSLGKVAEKDNAFEVALNNYFYGTTIQRGNRYCLSSPGQADTDGFVLMARIMVIEASADAPITFVFTQRRAAAPMHVHITLTNETAESSAVSSVVYEGANYGAYLAEVDGLTWDLYIRKSDAGDIITLQDWWTSQSMERRVCVIFPGTWAATVPEPYQEATSSKIQSILEYIYPVDSVYISYSHNDPATLFGGTWVRIQNAFLCGVDESGDIGTTGGTLVTGDAADNNMPPYVQVSIWRRTA